MKGPWLVGLADRVEGVGRCADPLARLDAEPTLHSGVVKALDVVEDVRPAFGHRAVRSAIHALRSSMPKKPSAAALSLQWPTALMLHVMWWFFRKSWYS